MPPRQVYGKKRTAHAGYDPDAIFGRLRCNKSSSPVEVKVVEVLGETAASIFHDQNDGKNGEVERSTEGGVLGLLDGNSLPRSRETPAVKGDARWKGRRRRVVEDCESEFEDENADDLPIGVLETATTTPPRRRSKDGQSELNMPSDVLPETPPTKTIQIRSPLEDKGISHCSDLLALSSHPPTSFSDWADQLNEHFSLTKIAEASFGEVYRLSLWENLPGFSSADESVLKIIPLRPSQDSLPLDKRKRDALIKKMADMSSPSHVANEVKLLQRMSSIPGFTNFRDVRIIRGRPATSFQVAYRDFNRAQKARGKETSHFADPGKKSSYVEDQLWAVIEMQDAGTDLEQLLEEDDADESKSIFSTWDIFWQVALSLAKGEEGAQFEHRDLHLGNICVRHQRQLPRTLTALSPSDLKGRKLHFTALETTVIDYTLSRARLADGTIAFHDLASVENASLFNADSTNEYQYDIYRYMRGAVLDDNVYAEISDGTSNTTRFPPADRAGGERSWQQSHPITNLIWLHYILYKLLERMAWPSEQRAPPRRLKGEVGCWKRGIDLEHVLLRVQDLLDPGALCGGGDENGEGLASVGDLVGLALTEGWVDVGDVVGEENGEDNELVEEMTALQLEFPATSEKDDETCVTVGEEEASLR